LAAAATSHKPDIASVAATLSGHVVKHITPVGGGGNSRVFRVDTAAGAYALKLYPAPSLDPRDRLGTEVGAIRFLKDAGIHSVPRVIAAESTLDAALYEWIDGIAISDVGAAEIDAVVAFLAALHRVRDATSLSAIRPASESCVSAADIASQITTRLEKLTAVAEDDATLDAFLEQEFIPAFGRLAAATRIKCLKDDVPFDAAIAKHYCVLSPSDFGFHNTLRRSDGSIVFVDFEYFGWDDPVKLACDFIWHPGMSLKSDAKHRFMAGIGKIFGNDPDFSRRLRRHYPLFGLRWCMILLNEFLPEGLARRRHAGTTTDTGTVRRAQLEKSQTLLRAVIAANDGFPYES
jgi:hypothetical protein